MGRYVITFSKQGFLRFTSHLDLMRLFKRAFKRMEIPLDYSKGFNPHPRMSFAQPLSLGYTAKDEFLEFHTFEEMDEGEMLRRIRRAMPMGLTVKELKSLNIAPKTLASIVSGARYEVIYPLSYEEWGEIFSAKIADYLGQETIVALKRQKKTKEYKEQDIKGQIGRIDLMEKEGLISLLLDLDSGSDSNLSPELVIQTLGSFMNLPVRREDIGISREFLFFKPLVPQDLGLRTDYRS